MIQFISKLKLKQQILTPNILYLVLLGAFIFFFISSNSMIGELTQKKRASHKVSEDIRHTAMDIKGYLNKEISFAQMENSYKSLLKNIKGQDLGVDFKGLWT